MNKSVFPINRIVNPFELFKNGKDLNSIGVLIHYYGVIDGKKQRTDRRGMSFERGLLWEVDELADEKISANRSKLINSALKNYIRENKPKKPVNKTQSSQFPNFSFSKPSVVRENHYHKHRIEWLCVKSDTGRILLEDIATYESKELLVSGSSPVLVKIYPHIAHVIENCANVPMHLLVIVNEKHSSKDSDTCF